MSAFTDRCDELEQQRGQLESALHRTLAQVAEQTVVETDVSGDPYDELIQQLSEIESLQSSLAANRMRIGELVTRLTEIGADSDQLHSEMRKIADELEPIFTEIGSVAFAVYRDNPLVDQEYADIFAPLLEIHEALKDIDGQISVIESEPEERQFLEKVVFRGKVVLLKNRRATREAAARKLYRKVGREIVNTGFINAIADPSLTQSVEPYLEQMKQTRSREQDVLNLADERDELASELETLGATKRPQRRIDEIDEEIEAIGEERVLTLARLGRLLVDNGREILPPSTKEWVAEAVKQKEELAGLESRLARIEAAVEVENLNAELDQLRDGVRKRQGHVERLAGEIKDLEARIVLVVKERKKKEALRGAAEELLK